MCELFAMSSRHPATVRLSLEEFARHGGLAGPHKDGWGIAFYDGLDVRIIREAEPAAHSACARLLRERGPGSPYVLSHIRRATQGAATLANTQPFARELAGRMHVFAHNGHLEPAPALPGDRSRSFRPVGDTDSERAFCALLERLRAPWLAADAVPALEERLAVVSAFARQLRALGPANFLYCDGDALFAHGHRRTHPDGVRPPGLHVLCRTCAAQHGPFEAGGLTIEPGADRQEVVLVASVPLTASEAWRPLEEGEVLFARGGRIVAKASPGTADRRHRA